MTLRLPAALGFAAACASACAKAEVPGDCSPGACSAICRPRTGTCATGTCVCLDNPDADAGDCEPTACAASCRDDGYPDGVCLGGTCQCTGSAADADADAPDVPDSPEARDDGTADDARPDDAGSDDGAVPDETTPADIGDPCTVDDLVEQEICGDGMKCTFRELAGTRPDPICDRDGRRDVNTSCSSYSESDTCVAGALCLNDGSGSRCRLLCRRDADCSPLGTGAGCLVTMRFGTTTVEGMQACTIGCGVLTSTGCEASQSCRPNFPDTGGSYTDCSETGSGTQGSDCAAGGSADCARRYQCFNVTGSGSQCLYICEMFRGGSDCPRPGLSCQDIGDPSGTLGACI